jgi:hypothetical protein
MRHPLRKVVALALSALVGNVAIAACSTDGATGDAVDAHDSDARSSADAVIGDTSSEPEGSGDLPGTFGHCCVDDQLLSCFCPADAACQFGVACADGGCVTGDGATCGTQDQ